MKTPTCSLVMAMVAGLVCGGNTYEAFAQAGAGPGSDVPGLTGSGSSTEGAGMKRDPHSGTVVPESGQQQSSAGVAEQPAGVGEKGSGQSQSTMERSGGNKSGKAESMAKSSAESGEGQTEKAMKQQEQKKKNR